MNRERLTNPNKKYKELKQKQKARISNIMYLETDRYLQEMKRPPETEEELEQISERVYRRVQGLGFWIPYREVANAYRKKCPHMIQRLQESGLPQHLRPKEKKAKSERIANAKKVKKRRKKKQEAISLPEQDDMFFFIAGYIPGGAPYGVTWEQMGLEPWEEIE